MESEPLLSRDLLGRAREICDAHDEKWMLSWVLVTAIPPAMMCGEPAQAGAFARECIPLHVALRDPSSLNVALNWLAGVASAEQDYRRVARLSGAERRLAVDVGGSPFDTGELQGLRESFLVPARAALGDEGYEAAFREGYRLPHEEAVAYAIYTER
jgi:non-specific serine/threonine protein kinase